MTAHDVDLKMRAEPRGDAAMVALSAAAAMLLLIPVAGFVPALRHASLAVDGLAAVLLAGCAVPFGSPAAAAWRLLAGGIATSCLVAYGFGLPVPRAVTLATDVALAGGLVLLCFPLLIAERMAAGMGPRFAALRRFALLPIMVLLASAGAYLASATGLPVLRAVGLAVGALVGLVSLEAVFRAAFALRMRCQDSPLFCIDLVLLRPLGPAMRGRNWSATLRENFGIDFARSWALHFFATALLPVGALLMAICVVLTGLVRIDTAERGLYLRLGHPVAVLLPGLHLLLPWPLGQIKRVEYGVIHAVPISFGDRDVSPDAQLVAALAPKIEATAEGPPPTAANRLWESSQPSDVTYLIASEEQPGSSQHRGGFELVSMSMRVLYRIGLDPASARLAATAAADPPTLVRMAASQLLARHLATRTLSQILVEDRGDMSKSLGRDLQAILDHLRTGIDILNIAVEAAHPPAGAAAAYRQVQAAEIGAQTAISVERGRAETTAGLAGRDAADALSRAQADAAERLAHARVLRTAIQADEDAFRASPGAFRLEHRFAALQGALVTGNADILDPRLDLTAPPTLDLRQPERAHAAASQETLP